MPYHITINNRHGMVHSTQTVGTIDAAHLELPGGFSLEITHADTAPHQPPHEYRAPRLVPPEGHFNLPCEVCRAPFGAAIHRRPR